MDETLLSETLPAEEVVSILEKARTQVREFVAGFAAAENSAVDHCGEGFGGIFRQERRVLGFVGEPADRGFHVGAFYEAGLGGGFSDE